MINYQVLLMINFGIVSILILFAVVLSILVFIFLIGWWRGVDNILFPGLGLVVAMPGLIVLLLILSIAFVVFAAYLKPKRDFVGETGKEQKFEYPNDIFGGCGNGTLDLSLAENPNKYNAKTDRALKICINYDDIFAIQDAVVSGRIDYQNLQNNAEYKDADENNRKVFQEFALLHPMLSRINDMYRDYVFSPDEIQKLREECLKLKSTSQNAAADLALRKFIFACDEALKDNSFLVLSSD